MERIEKATVSLRFEDPATGRTETLGPAPWFRVSGNYVRVGPKGEICVTFVRHQWTMRSHHFTRFSNAETVLVHFEDAAGGPTPDYGPFNQLRASDGVIYADGKLFSKFIEESQLWHCYPTENFWPVLVLKAPRQDASASRRTSPG